MGLVNVAKIAVVKKSIFDILKCEKATLVVNVASQCALTPQYEELVTVEKALGPDFTILAFPCNHFGDQESEPIERFRKDVKEQYSVTFPIYSKIDVNGENAAPLYKAMKKSDVTIVGSPQVGNVSWKFLQDDQGNVVQAGHPSGRHPGRRQCSHQDRHCAATRSPVSTTTEFFA